MTETRVLQFYSKFDGNLHEIFVLRFKIFKINILSFCRFYINFRKLAHRRLIGNYYNV